MKKIFVAALFLGTLLSPYKVWSQTENSGREGLYRATHTKTTELKHTKLKVNFDYQKEQMNGEAWITASPYFYPSDSLVLNAKAMLIHEVALDTGKAKTPLKFDYKNNILNIALNKEYERNQDYTVYIKYTARPNEVTQEGSAAINGAKGLYFINAQGKELDKPTQIWTQGETESSSVWFPTIDKSNQKMTQEIYMTVPDQYVTLSNGILKDSKKEGHAMRTDHWVMEKKHSPYLFFMGVGDYAIVRDKWRNIPVDYYIEKEYEPYAKQIYGHTPEMMEFYSKYLNYDYPWPKYAQMSARDYVSGAMENTTATLHGESVLQKPGQLADENIWESVIAHELFHHWFGDLVTAESWSNLTVNESFANYSEYLWFEHKYGKDMADYHLMKDRERYLYDPSDYDKDLVRFNYASREDVFDLVTYQKGAAILHMLRNYLGDAAFRAGLNVYLKENEYSTGEAHQIRLALEKVSGKDLNWFFNQWYFSNGHPKLSYTYNYEPVKKQVVLTIHQSQAPLFQFPLVVDVYQDGKPVRQKVWADAKTDNTFVFTSLKKKPELVNINADGVLLAEIKEDKTSDQYLLQYQNSKEFLSRYKAVEHAYRNVDKNEADLKTLLAGLKDPFFRIRMLALKGLDLSQPHQAKLALAQVLKLVTDEPKTLVRAEAIGALAKTKDKKYENLYEKGIKAVSNAVVGKSLGALMTIAPEKVISYMDQLNPDDVSADLESILAPLIVKNKILKLQSLTSNIAAFYPFINLQSPEEGKVAEEAYTWIMQTDSSAAVKRLIKILNQIKTDIGDNPRAKMLVLDMLKSGLNMKMKVLKSNPHKSNLHQQVEWINHTIDSYSK
ncbi:M1 family peptidase [Elizabethkingia argentiflava]|uniref:Aminopeptidase N n=1 Tax=Elizabethkingia argenteiflava TaxID=2681556 RepID=A0A845PW44_9FLAO|nr:M1 family aminopeptidase [Elizabethkingia argenteiflava]NAW51191.1 M1 family peptidase [Elizabethkingia argenteiflava]